MIGRFEDGTISMEASYKDGLPHGQQLRRFPDGSPALEAIFDNGILSGIKTKWWGKGIIREEEYWSDGKYRGRRLWDQEGRLKREKSFLVAKVELPRFQQFDPNSFQSLQFG